MTQNSYLKRLWLTLILNKRNRKMIKVHDHKEALSMSQMNGKRATKNNILGKDQPNKLKKKHQGPM